MNPGTETEAHPAADTASYINGNNKVTGDRIVHDYFWWIFQVNIKIASRAGSVMTVQSSNVENSPGFSTNFEELNLKITLIPKMTGTGGPKHFTATYGTAYDEERVGGYLLWFAKC